MIDHSQRAMELFRQGYNCSQSVFASFSEELGMDFETALKIASSFGGGMGRLREVCGAVSGMFMVAGLKYGYSDPEDHKAKTAHYQLIQELADRFKEVNHSIVCRELLGLKAGSDSPIPSLRTKDYYQKRPCVEMVGCAAGIMEKVIQEMEERKLKLMIPVESTSMETPVCPSFGRTPYFAFIDTESEKPEFLDNSAAASQGGAGVKAAQMLVDSGAKALITFRCGENAAEVLKAADIQLFKAQEGSAADNIALYKDGKLTPLTEIHPGFHNQGG